MLNLASTYRTEHINNIYSFSMLQRWLLILQKYDAEVWNSAFRKVSKYAIWLFFLVIDIKGAVGIFVRVHVYSDSPGWPHACDYFFCPLTVNVDWCKPGVSRKELVVLFDDAMAKGGSSIRNDLSNSNFSHETHLLLLDLLWFTKTGLKASVLMALCLVGYDRELMSSPEAIVPHFNQIVIWESKFCLKAHLRDLTGCGGPSIYQTPSSRCKFSPLLKTFIGECLVREVL